jgi:hypothetical protein
VQKTGVIMETNGRQAVVLTMDGEFCSVTVPANAGIGAEVQWEPVQSSFVRTTSFQTGRNRFRFKVAAAAVGLVACLTVAAGIWHGSGTMSGHRAYAYVALDISPAIKITVNRDMRVLQVTSSDPAGKTLLQGVHLKNIGLDDAVKTIVQKAADEGLIRGDNNILIAASPVSTTGDVNVKTMQTAVQRDVKQALSGDSHTEKLHPHIYSYEVSPKVWAAADRLQISPAQLAAYVVENHNGHHVDLSAVHTVQLKGANQHTGPQAVVQDSLDVQTLLQSVHRGSIRSSSVSG